MYAQKIIQALAAAKTTIADLVGRAFPQTKLPPAAAPGPASTPNLNAILLNLCDGDHELALYVQRWIALPLRQPVTRNSRALWIQGGQGAGKSMYFDRLVAPMFGLRASILGNELHSVFNDWALNKQLVVAEDFTGERASMPRIKHMITSHQTMINRKALGSLQVRNRVNFVFLSGHVDALAADACDRRFVVINAGHALQPDIYAGAAKELASGASEVYQDYLLHDLDMTGFHEYTPAPQCANQKEAA